MKHGERSGSSHISLLNRGIYFSKIIMYSPPPPLRAQKFRMVFHTMLTCFPVIMSSWGKIWKFEGAWGKNMWNPCLFPMFSSIFPIFHFCFPFFLSLLPSFFSSFFSFYSLWGNKLCRKRGVVGNKLSIRKICSHVPPPPGTRLSVHLFIVNEHVLLNNNEVF